MRTPNTSPPCARTTKPSPHRRPAEGLRQAHRRGARRGRPPGGAGRRGHLGGVLRRDEQEHRRGLNVAGSIAGLPTIHINGRPFFGPVLGSIPRGEQAGKVWDAVETLATNPDFWELKS